METRDIRSEFPGLGGERDEHQKLDKEGKSWKERWDYGEAGTRRGLPDYVSPNSGNRQLPKIYHHRNSVLPLQWKITHSSRWKTQLLASELSLIAFILLLVMVFSKKWLYISACRFYQHWPTHIRNKIYTSAHTMSMGLLQICTSKNCLISENGKDNFKMWINHPLFGVAKITFSLALVLGFIFTIWLHLPYIPGLQRLSLFGWIGTLMSFCEVALIFSTLILFPINVWIFELKRNLSLPIGWSYFIGWMVFILYVTCAFLCYFNNKNFWSLILNCSSDTMSCSSSMRSGSLSEPVGSDISVK